MYEYNMKLSINMDVLGGVLNDYWYAHGEYERFCDWLRRFRYTSKYYDNRQHYEEEYRRLYSADSSAYDVVFSICKLLELDFDTVNAVFKSIRRNCQYQNNWGREAHFSNNRYFEFEGKRPGSVESFCDLCRKS